MGRVTGVDVIGIAEPVAVPSREAVLDDERMIQTHAHAVGGMLVVENPGFVCGGRTRWRAATQGLPASTGAAMPAGVAGGAIRDHGEAAAASVQPAADPVAPSAEHRGVHDNRYGAYRRRFDGVEGSLG
jgi:hypothetical protein